MRQKTKDRNKYLLNQRGMALPLAISVVLMVTILSGIMLSAINNEFGIRAKAADITKSKYMAEAGVEHAIAYITNEIEKALLGDYDGTEEYIVKIEAGESIASHYDSDSYYIVCINSNMDIIVSGSEEEGYLPSLNNRGFVINAQGTSKSSKYNIEAIITFPTGDINYIIDKWSEVKSYRCGSSQTSGSILADNIMVYGSSLTINGSGSVNYNNSHHGTVIITEGPDKLVVGGSTKLLLKNIYIDRTTAGLEVNGSGRLGDRNRTDVVSIKGDVTATGGSTPSISGNYVYIDGNVGVSGSANIDANTVVITGNVNLTGSGRIKATNVYIGGTVTGGHLITGSRPDYSSRPDAPATPNVNFPDEINTSVVNSYNNIIQRQDMRYYKSSGNIVIDANSTGSYNNAYYNAVIVSGNGNITLRDWIGVTGVLYAPKGKVTFEGHTFNGLVIARDGFDIVNGSATVTFDGIDSYIPNPNDYPFIEK